MRGFLHNEGGIAGVFGRREKGERVIVLDVTWGINIMPLE